MIQKKYAWWLSYCSKRVLDFLVAICCLWFFGPLMAIIAALIRLDSKGSIFFRQSRIGLNGKPFRIWKFRTMVSDAEACFKEVEQLNESGDGLFKIKRDPRVTRIGYYLRRWSLDELPQIFNVLLGDMSLVGPRPLSIRDSQIFLAQDETSFKLRTRVLPGITGLWQVSGRSNLTGAQMIALDIEYVMNFSIVWDVGILLKTVVVLVNRDGAY